jgi:hypothetical protein
MNQSRVMRPLSEALASVTAELADLARGGEALEHLVIRLTAKADVADKTLMYEVQGVDHFVQRLNGLATFVRGLSETIPDGVSVDVLTAVRDLTLTDQAKRLTGCPADSGGEVDGDCLLFGD